MIEFDILNDIGGQNLHRLAQMLEAGLLTPPYSALSLDGLIAQPHCEILSAFLTQLAQRLESPRQIGLVLRSFAAGRGYTKQPFDNIDVVVSGPDASSIARDTGVVMRQMFGSAQHRVLAVGFAIHQGKEIFRTLAEQFDMHDHLEVVLCVDVRREPSSTAREDRIITRFARNLVENEWPGRRLPSVYYDPRSLASRGVDRSALHSKCVVVDGTDALVTSANFTEAAQERNIELGLRVSIPSVARRIEVHFYTLIKDGHLIRLPLP